MSNPMQRLECNTKLKHCGVCMSQYETNLFLGNIYNGNSVMFRIRCMYSDILQRQFEISSFRHQGHLFNSGRDKF